MSGWRVILLAAALLPLRLAAQVPASPPVEPELRADLLVGRRTAVQVGAGVQVPAGLYVRIGADAAVGARAGALDARVDLVGRFLLDPFRQSAIGVSAGAGVGIPFEGDGASHTPLLIAVIDLEGRRRLSGWVPALQLGLGGGARLGVVLRRGVASAR